METLSLGFSPCPNDTYIFYALTHNKIPLDRISFAPAVLDDVETLNGWALEQKLDVTKLSFHALGHVLDNYVMLNAGAALGRGCGPLLVARNKQAVNLRQARIAIPGKYTTAAMLMKLYAPEADNLLVMRFEEIMPAVSRGTVDAGVIIHESRFIYHAHGLECVQDLGAWWEEETGLPIPLGCIAARRTLPGSIHAAVDGAISRSLRWANANPAQCMEYIRRHAQEMDDAVMQNHISLYVNDFSEHMGEEGREAVLELMRRGRSVGIFPDDKSRSRFTFVRD